MQSCLYLLNSLSGHHTKLPKPFPGLCNVEMLGDYKLQDKALPKCLIDGATLINNIHNCASHTPTIEY